MRALKIGLIVLVVLAALGAIIGDEEPARSPAPSETPEDLSEWTCSEAVEAADDRRDDYRTLDSMGRDVAAEEALQDAARLDGIAGEVC